MKTNKSKDFERNVLLVFSIIMAYIYETQGNTVMMIICIVIAVVCIMAPILREDEN